MDISAHKLLTIHYDPTHSPASIFKIRGKKQGLFSNGNTIGPMTVNYLRFNSQSVKEKSCFEFKRG